MEKNKITINLLLIVISILVVVACIMGYLYFTKEDIKKEMQEKEEKKQSLVIFNDENYPKVEGITMLQPLVNKFKETYTGSETKETINIQNEEQVYNKLINGETDMIITTYPSDEMIQSAKDKNIELEITPIAKDAFVFLVNKDNTIENLTLEQIQQIYSGKIKNWRNVEGPNIEIIAYQCPTNSFTQSGMLKLVMKDKMMTPPQESLNSSTGNIVDVISQYVNQNNSIAYSYLYNANTMYKNENVKFLSINGVAPTYDNIKNGLYNLQTTYYAVVKKGVQENSNVSKLLNEIKNEKGQEIVREAGYVQNY